MLRLIFLRHGEGEHQKLRWSGVDRDAALTTTGREQSREAALQLAKEQHERKPKQRISAIYASPYLRTLQTARIVADILREGASDGEDDNGVFNGQGASAGQGASDDKDASDALNVVADERLAIESPSILPFLNMLRASFNMLGTSRNMPAASFNMPLNMLGASANHTRQRSAFTADTYTADTTVLAVGHLQTYYALGRCLNSSHHLPFLPTAAWVEWQLS